MNESRVCVSLITYNDENILEDCLKSVRAQNYHSIDILIVDGGSNDNTINIAKKYNSRLIVRKDLINHPEKRIDIAFNVPKSDFILFVSADNRIKEIDVVSQMVEVMERNALLSAVSTRLYGYNKTDKLLSQYFSLIGGVDPIAIALGKADRSSYDSDLLTLHGKATDHGSYYIVKYEKDMNKIPTLGANGYMYRAKLVQGNQYIHNGLHVDTCTDLILNGYDEFAFIKDRSIIHKIDIGLIKMIKRRLLWAAKYSPNQKNRLYFVFERKDLRKLINAIFHFCLFFPALFRSIKGYRSQKNLAWFYHPIVGLLYVVSYGVSFFMGYLRRVLIGVYEK